MAQHSAEIVNPFKTGTIITAQHSNFIDDEFRVNGFDHSPLCLEQVVGQDFGRFLLESDSELETVNTWQQQ